MQSLNTVWVVVTTAFVCVSEMCVCVSVTALHVVVMIPGVHVK